MKALKVLAFLAISSMSANLWSAQIDYYKGTDCDDKLVQITTDFLAEMKTSVDDVISKNLGEKVELNLETLQLCDIQDQDPGSYDIRRKVTFCADIVDEIKVASSTSVYVMTEGDMFCEGEKVVSYLGTWVH
jgi:hypothetical protein